MLAGPDVHPRVTMQILRHSKSAITMKIYTEASSAATRARLRKHARRSPRGTTIAAFAATLSNGRF
jgi:hypothetical protein